MGALTGASLIGQALIPTKVSEQEKKEIIEQTKRETQKPQTSISSKINISKNKNILIFAAIIGVIIFLMVVLK
jgi:hypothetical protein